MRLLVLVVLRLLDQHFHIAIHGRPLCFVLLLCPLPVRIVAVVAVVAALHGTVDHPDAYPYVYPDSNPNTHDIVVCCVEKGLEGVGVGIVWVVMMVVR